MKRLAELLQNEDLAGIEHHFFDPDKDDDPCPEARSKIWNKEASPDEVVTEQMRKMVSLVDSGAISRKSHHEMAQMFPCLPRLHKVNAEMKEQILQIEKKLDVRTNEECTSCHVDPALMVEKMLEKKNIKIKDGKLPFAVLSFDGRAVQNKHDSTLGTIKCPRLEGTRSERKDGLHPFWMSQCKEKRPDLKAEWDEHGLEEAMNKFNEWVLCCDGKAVNAFCGLDSHGSDGSCCPWCPANRAERCDMGKSWRTEDDRLEPGKPGVRQGPIFSMKPDKMTPEAMHMGNRIMMQLQNFLFMRLMRVHGQKKAKDLLVKWYHDHGFKQFKMTLRVNKMRGKCEDYTWTVLPVQPHFRMIEKQDFNFNALFPKSLRDEATWTTKKWREFMRLLRAVDVHGKVKVDMKKWGLCARAWVNSLVARHSNSKFGCSETLMFSFCLHVFRDHVWEIIERNDMRGLREHSTCNLERHNSYDGRQLQNCNSRGTRCRRCFGPNCGDASLRQHSVGTNGSAPIAQRNHAYFCHFARTSHVFSI